MDILESIQRVIQENYDAQKPAEFTAGTVVSASPLKISIDVQLPPLEGDALILTQAVKAWNEEVNISINGGTQQTAVIYHRALAQGDKVVMLRVAHGQRFIVLSRA